MDMQKIGNFLRTLRKERGLTQEQLAEIIGVAGRTVSRWETGSNMPDLSILIRLAEYYDVDVKEILKGERKSEMMEKEMKETLSMVADYSEMEKEVIAKTGNASFGIMFFVCAAAIVIQLMMLVNLPMVMGETVVLLLGGVAYLALIVHNGAWDFASGKKRTAMQDGVLSVVVSGIFSAAYYFTISRASAETEKIAFATACFFIGISSLCFLVLRMSALISKKRRAQQSR